MGIFGGLFGNSKDKPRADFGNVQAGGSSTGSATSAEEGPGASGTPVATGRYVVVSGDSLSKIAKREYGDAQRWPMIYEANRDVVKDPDLIYPGQELRIPLASGESK